jgi:glucose/arabinose dehydrogenase
LKIREVTAISAAVICLLAAPPSASAQLRSQLIVSGLSHPVAIVEDPTQTNVFFIAEQNGRIRTLVNGVLVGDFLDLTSETDDSSEQGLLGLVLDPNYAANRRFFVNYTNLSGDTVISRYQRSESDPLAADPGTRFDLVWPDGNPFIDQSDDPGFQNHRGGHLAFGPDGMLYIGMGDGGGGDDFFHLAQMPHTLLGKMLRINVSVDDSDPEGYDVPGDNPFAGDDGVLDEIWAFGLRNPWRYSFDNMTLGGTGGLLIGDVGQDMREEISFGPLGVGGRNYGWRNREGTVDNDTSLDPFPIPLTDPIHDYDRDVGRTVTGGYVYRGSELGAGFVGRYFFGDFLGPQNVPPPLGRVWSFVLHIDGTTGEASFSDLVDHTAELGAAAVMPVSFAEGVNGELYVVNRGGTIYKIVSDLVSNGDFSGGMSGWFTWAQPSQGDLNASVSGGMLQFNRDDVPDAPTNQGVIIHPTGQPVADDTAVVLTFDMGNTSPSRKRIAVLVHDADFSDFGFCTFWIPATTGLQTYRIRTHTTESWSGATLSFYAASEGTDGFYLLDNVSFVIDPEGEIDRTICEDPEAPSPPGGVAGSNLIVNGSFSTAISALTDWGTFGQIDFEQNGGVFEFRKLAGEPAGVLLQDTHVTTIAAGDLLTAGFFLGNSSGVRQRVTVILHAEGFGDLAACTFWLRAGQSLAAYTMRTFATTSWNSGSTSAMLSVYPATAGGGEWLRIDDVELRETPSSAIVGTECIEPPVGSALGLAAPSLKSPAGRRAAPSLDPRSSRRAGSRAVRRFRLGIAQN